MDHSDPLGLYRVLGISPTATAEEIAAAFRRRSKETHPDTSGRESAEEFVQVSAAYEVLGDPVRRGEYDRAARELDEQKAAREPAQQPFHAPARYSPRQVLPKDQTQRIIVICAVVGAGFGLFMAIDHHKKEAEAARAQERLEAILHPVPTCANPPKNGTYLGPRMKVTGLHYLVISNQTEYDMIFKWRDVKSGHAVVTLFIERGGSVEFRNFGDGRYKQQFVFGDKLDTSCEKFLKPVSIRQGSEVQVMAKPTIGSFEWRVFEYNFNSIRGDASLFGGRYSFYADIPLAEFQRP